MSIRGKHILFVLFAIFSSKAVAEPYIVKRLGVEQGLSNNFVVGITQDKQGFLWFATEEGLNKFDGTRFVTYYKNEDNKQSITGNELNKVYADGRRPLIWIATQRSGLNAYNYETRTFTVYRHDQDDPHSLITDDVTDISFSSRSAAGIWVSTYYRGIDYLDISTGKFTHYNKATVPDMVNEQTWTVLDGGDGNLYIGHVNGGLSILSLASKRLRNFVSDRLDPTSLPGNNVRCIYKDNNGNIWVGTDHGLALFNPENGSFINFRNNINDPYGVLSSYIFSIHQMNDGKLWIATEFKGIAVLDLKQNQFLSPDQIRFASIREGDSSHNLSASSVRCVYQDSFNNIWLGTWGGGIDFVSSTPPLFTTLAYSPVQTENSLNNKVVSSVCMDNEDRLWVGTDGGGINVFKEGKRVAVYQKKMGQLQDNSVLSSYCDSEGNLWFGTFQGSISFYDVRRQAFRIINPGGDSHLDVRVFYEDSKRNIWIGTNNGLFSYNMDSHCITRHYDKLHGNLVRCISQDSKGRFWIGTFGDGLGVYTPELKLMKWFVQRDGFPSNTINQIIRDNEGQMWVATGEGLICFPSSDSFAYRTYQRKNGLHNTLIRALIEDRGGNIWVSTNNGISCFVRQKGTFYNYNYLDDVPRGTFSTSCVTCDRDGDIYFGSINGLCCFNPAITMNAPQVPPVVITEMKVFGHLVDMKDKDEAISFSMGKPVVLSYTQNNFSLTFNIQNYSFVNRVEYAYMLKGVENSWYAVNEKNSVTFRNLPPGSYEILVKARIHNQPWQPDVAKLSIRIKPPLWGTLWAKLTYLFVFLIVLYAVIRAYKRKLMLENLYKLEKKNHEQEQELNNERLRFYTNITHELRTPLTLILGPLEDMQKDTTLLAKQQQKISVIRQSALRLLNLINQILEFRKTETQNRKLCVSKENLVILVQEIELKYKELNRKPGVEFVVEVENEEISLYFDREVITIILDNLISNAIKYTEKGRITLSLYNVEKKGNHYTEIKVSDTGYGISNEALSHVFDRYYQEKGRHQASGTGIGLSLVMNLVKLHEAEIFVESDVNVGSSFYVSLLTDNTYPHAIHCEVQKEDSERDKGNLLPVEEDEQLNENANPILLVVEDNADILEYISDSFSDSFEVVLASNGEVGLERAFEILPDIIVSDVMMPVMDGMALCRKLKGDMRTSHIPIILLTAKDGIEDKEQGYQVGADSYLTKPFSASLLRSRINNLLESRKKLIEQFATNKDLSEKRTIMVGSLTRLDNEFIDKIAHLIEEDLASDKIDVTYLSDKVFMSRSTLYRKMKALTGLSTNEFIRKVKMQNAERFLLEGKYSISEVAFMVGINSPVYFRQCFKEEFGLSPSDYLKQIRPS